MNILYILNSLNRGGAESLVYDVLKNSPKNKLHIILIALNGGSLLEKFQEISENIIVVKRNNKYSLKPFFLLIKIIKKYNIKIIHAHGTLGCFFAEIVSYFINVKVIMTIHGYNPKLSKKNGILLKILVPRIDGVIFVSKSFKNYFFKNIEIKHKPNIYIVYNGIDKNRLKENGINYKHQIGLKRNSILLGMIGNFNWGRDQYFIIKSITNLLRKYDIYLIFAGSRYPGYEYLYDKTVHYCDKSGLSDKIFFLGSIDNIGDFYKSIDIYVYASVLDSFGLTIVEAMLYGKPIICNDTPVFREITNNGKYAYLYRTSDGKELCSAILNVINNKNLKNTVDIIKYAESRFSIDIHIKNLIQIYKNNQEAVLQI